MTGDRISGADRAGVQGLTDRVPPEGKDEFYHDILDGLSVFLGSAYISDIQYATKAFPYLRLGHALNLGQVRCKKWLLDELAAAVGTNYGAVYILGGWYGVLGAMFLHEPRFNVGRVVSVDIEPSCKPIAEALNRTGVESGRFFTLTADIHDLDYPAMLDNGGAGEGPALLINTSCEHLSDFDRWFDRIPEGALVVLQSNNYYDCEEHINCVPDIAAFERQAPLSAVLFRGEMPLRKYTRFMLIGRR